MAENQNEKPGCLTAILNIFRGKHLNENQYEETYLPADIEEPLPYRVRDDFLSPSEISFFHILESVLNQKAVIFPKVRLADVFFVSQPNKNLSFFNQISAKHVDFLVCKPDRLTPVLGIELDDSSHNQPDRQDRDECVTRVFQDANLPLLRFPAKRTYLTEDIVSSIEPFFLPTSPAKSLTSPKMQSLLESHAENAQPVPVCPKCGIPMVLRTASQGDFKGKQFYGCANYPRCREIRPYMPQTA